MLLFMSPTKPLISGYLIYVDIMNSLFIVSHHIIWLGRCSHWMNIFWAHITLSRATYSTEDQWGCSTLGLYVHACGLNLVFFVRIFLSSTIIYPIHPSYCPERHLFRFNFLKPKIVRSIFGHILYTFYKIWRSSLVKAWYLWSLPSFKCIVLYGIRKVFLSLCYCYCSLSKAASVNLNVSCT